MNTLPNFEELLLADGARYITRLDEVVEIELREMGEIEFPSRQVIVADPDETDLNDWPALHREAPSGRHPIYTTTILEEEYDSIIAVWIRFSDNPVARWEAAVFGEPGKFKFEQPGTTMRIFVGDAATSRTLGDPDSIARLEEVFDVDDEKFWDARFHPDAPDTVFVATSGDTNGYFIPYWGMDADNKPAYLVIDYDELKLPVWDTFTLDLPLERGPIEHEVIIRAEGKLVCPRFPFWGPKKLVATDETPQVRLLRNGEPIEEISGEVSFKDMSTTFTIDHQPGDKLEISYVTSYVPAQPLQEDDKVLW